MKNPSQHRHSFFWPILLVGVGVIWLLVNLGIIAPASLINLWQFWPVLLILLGLDILFAHRFAWIGSLIGVLTVAGLVGYLILQPNTGATTSVANQVVSETFNAPVSDTTSVTYNFETASEPVHLFALGSDSTNLVNAQLTHIGTVDFAVTGSQAKLVALSESTNPANWFNWMLTPANLKWDIGLASGIPTDISLNGGSGAIDADLSGVELQTLTANLGSGASTFTLPQVQGNMSFKLNSGSGAVNITLPAETNVELRVESGSGALNIQLPADAAVYVQLVNSGSGSFNKPDGLVRVSGNDESGSWQSAGYDQAKYKIVIKILDQGSGSINIH